MEDNASITEHGRFWLNDNDQKKLWGTLYINEVNDASLETFGSLIDLGERGPHTIVGEIRARQELVTLMDCFPTTTHYPRLTQGRETDWSLQTVRANGVVTGIGFEKGEEVAFSRAVLSLSTLPEWANPNQVKLDFAEDQTGPYRANISIVDRADETSDVRFRDEELTISLQFSPKIHGGRQGVINRYSVEDHCYLAVKRFDGGKILLKSILSVAKAIQDLLSICFNETARVEEIVAFHEITEWRPLKVHVRTLGIDVEGKKRRPFPALRLEALGGMAAIARWLEKTEEYGMAATLVASWWYSLKAYNEDKFLRMYTAVEGLVARKKGNDIANMREAELAEFVEENMPGFSSITNVSAEDWAKNVRDLRNKNIGHLDPTSTLSTDGRTMHVMANILYTAGASFLLKEMGVGEDQIARYIRETSGSLLLREQP